MFLVLLLAMSLMIPGVMAAPETSPVIADNEGFLQRVVNFMQILDLAEPVREPNCRCQKCTFHHLCLSEPQRHGDGPHQMAGGAYAQETKFRMPTVSHDIHDTILLPAVSDTQNPVPVAR